MAQIIFECWEEFATQSATTFGDKRFFVKRGCFCLGLILAIVSSFAVAFPFITSHSLVI